MKGYKVFNPDWTCDPTGMAPYKYEVGGTYEEDVDLSVCHRGFHFCQKASDCFNYYSFDRNNKVAEVEALGEIKTDGDKSVTNKIHIVREIPWNELLDIVNEGICCTGLCNTGSWNSGYRNSGYRNSGDCNSGHHNSGDWNSGGYNSGDCNSGHHNSGDWNSGGYNSGNCNSGDRNTGNHNSGYRTSGDWNSGGYNSGFFNTVTPQLLLFNKPTELSRKEILSIHGVRTLNAAFQNNCWIESSNMSEEEKEQHPEHKTTGGYLRTVDFKTACRIMWEKLTGDERQAVKKIPNFDAEIFEEITGVKVKM